MIKPIYKMTEVVPSVFLIQIQDHNDLAYTFLRVQEFYESANSEFQGKKFTLSRYKEWYSSQSDTGTFSYGEDWKGFNVPSDVIHQCYQLNDERTDYDNFFLSLVDRIELTGTDQYYVIGARADDNLTIDHEIAHGFFTVNSVYRGEMNDLISKLPTHVTEYMTNYLSDLGYADSVHMDEIQAYMATGLRKDMIQSLLQYTQNFQEVFCKFKENSK